MHTKNSCTNKATTYFFAVPSVAEEVGRLLDFGNTLTEYNDSFTPSEADARAMFMDWRAVGCDLMQSSNQLTEELHEQQR